MKLTRLHQHAARTRHADGVARDEAYKSLRVKMAARALGKVPLSRLFCSHLPTRRDCRPSAAAWQPRSHGPPVVHTTPTALHCTSASRLRVPHNYARSTAKSAIAATAPSSSSRGAWARGIGGRTGQSAWSNLTSVMGCCPSIGCPLGCCRPARAIAGCPEASERSSTALTVLHCTAPGAHAKPQRVLHGAPPHIPRGCYQNRRTAAAWAGVQVNQLVQR